MEDNGGPDRIAVGFNDCGELVAGEPRHVDIKQNKIGLKIP